MSIYTEFNPNQPPLPLLTDELESFPNLTMRQRMPKMLQDVLADHPDYPLEIAEAVQALLDELVNNDLVSPLNSNAPDAPRWYEAWQPHRDKRWLEIPWFFAESFLYRRLLQATGYFGWPLVAVQQRSPTPQSRAEVEAWEGVDPFLPRKQAELANPVTWQTVQTALQDSTENNATTLGRLFQYCLWGNRADLCYTEVAESAGEGITVQAETSNLLVDDSSAVIAYLSACREISPPSIPPKGGEARQMVQINMICDNAGTEILMDLVLVDYLLRFNWADYLIMHVKAHPTFVSDTTPADLYQTIMALQSQPQPALRELGKRLLQYGERLQVNAESFWNSSHFFWQFPYNIQVELAQSDLVILKGDANYRRLIGDSIVWSPTTPISDAVPYFPTSFVTIRTLKSNGIVGLSPSQVEQLEAQAHSWRVDGQHGVIQAVLQDV
ncbi:damage-control phosphatase ARMT1 family protein [Anaerolineales bacterium HSG6]|nr:damage-control phosphatase ARMT1 family protein [Anaerolineales bacterium HSG6]